MGLDAAFTEFLTGHFSFPLLLDLGDALNRLGKGDALAFCCILFGIFAYGAVRPRALRASGAGLLTLSLVGPIVQGLKHLFGRARPQMNLGDWYWIGPNLAKNGFDSFPSGHAMSTFAVAAFFSQFYPRLRIPLYSTAAATSLIGRVLHRHHYLSDIIVGGALGVALGWVCARWFGRWIEAAEPVETRAAPGWSRPRDWISLPKLASAALLSALIFAPGIDKDALWDRDETEYAQATIEMRDRGEWLIPTLEGQPFIEKPILLFWTTRASLAAFGASECGFRLPSVLLGVLTCALAAALGGLLWTPRAGLFAGIVLATSLLFVGGTRLLMTDPLFVFFSVLSLIFYTLSRKHPERRARYQAANYLAIGLMVLSKGPIGFFPTVVYTLHEAWLERPSLGAWLRRSVIPHGLYSLIALAIAAPWFVYSFAQEKSATSTFFLYDNLARFSQGMEGHTGPMFYYVLVLALGLAPWAFFAAGAAVQEWKRAKSEGVYSPEVSLLLAWILFLFVFFSISANKLPHYMMPVLPALACLTGRFWDDLLNGARFPLRRLMLPTAIVAGILLAAVVALHWIRPQYASWRLTLPFLLLFAAVLVARAKALRGDLQSAFAGIAAGSVALFVSFSYLGLPWVDSHRVMKPIGLAIRAEVPREAELFGYHVSEPSLFIYGGRMFRLVEHTPLHLLMDKPAPVYAVVNAARLPPGDFYRVIASKKGFAENGGEMEIALITNKAAP